LPALGLSPKRNPAKVKALGSNWHRIKSYHFDGYRCISPILLPYGSNFKTPQVTTE
jgi:hypothetical protein